MVAGLLKAPYVTQTFFRCTHLDALADEERTWLCYLAALRAGEQNYEPLARHRDLAKEALDFWRDHQQRAAIPDWVEIRSALDVFRNPDFNPEVPVWSVVSKNPESPAAHRLVTCAPPSGGSR